MPGPVISAPPKQPTLRDNICMAQRLPSALPRTHIITRLPPLALNANSSRHNAQHQLCAQQDQSKQFIHTNTLHTGNC